jgi:hypothetical protein
MLNLFDILFIGILLFITYQDFKYRTISIWTIPVMFVLVLIINLNSVPAKLLFTNALINIVIFLCQLALVTVYFSVKHKKITNIVNRYLGAGDIYFILLMGIMFSPLLFLFFLVVGLIAVGIGFAFSQLVLENHQNTIPLAGGLAIMLVLLWTGKIILGIGQVYSIAAIERLIIG